MNSETMMTMPVAPTGYGNGGGFGFGGDGAWWIILFLIFGWGNNGFGGGYGGGCGGEIQSGFNQQATISKLDSITGTLCGISAEIANQGCETRHTIESSTRDIMENANANSRAILDFLVKDKIDTLTAENQSLRLAASQSNQNAVLQAAMDANTAELLRRIAPTPVPAYSVPNPNAVYGYGCGCGCGCNGYGTVA